MYSEPQFLIQCLLNNSLMIWFKLNSVTIHSKSPILIHAKCLHVFQIFLIRSCFQNPKRFLHIVCTTSTYVENVQDGIQNDSDDLSLLYNQQVTERFKCTSLDHIYNLLNTSTSCQISDSPNGLFLSLVFALRGFHTDILD